MEPKWLLFGLEGVLAESTGAQMLLPWMRRPVAQWELMRMWLYSPAVRAFDSGRVSPLIFACDVIAEFGLEVHPDEFLRAFPNFTSAFHPGARQLLEDLAARYPLALLANTNQPQWGRLCAASDIPRFFRKQFLSFKTGLLKPDAEAYLAVLQELRCAPQDTLLLDAGVDNVRGALDAGMRAECVTGFENLHETILKLNLL